MVTKLAGKCRCGAVRYEVADAFRYAANCHCSGCRATTGSAFKPFAGIEREQLEITQGLENLSSSERRTPTTRVADRVAPSSSPSYATAPSCTSRWAPWSTHRASARPSTSSSAPRRLVRDHRRPAAVRRTRELAVWTASKTSLRPGGITRSRQAVRTTRWTTFTLTWRLPTWVAESVVPFVKHGSFEPAQVDVIKLSAISTCGQQSWSRPAIARAHDLRHYRDTRTYSFESTKLPGARLAGV